MRAPKKPAPKVTAPTQSEAKAKSENQLKEYKSQLGRPADPYGQQGMSGAGLAGMARPQQGMSGAGLAGMARPQPPSTTSRMSGLGATGMGARAMGMKKGGKVSSASKRADGCAIKGKTKGKIV